MTSANQIEAEFEEIEQHNDWQHFYQCIKDRSDREAKERSYSVDASNLPNNRRLNRYRDVNPYDHSRILLRRGDTDYINANLVRMERAKRRYILTQGPLQNTVSHFWTMVWEQNTRAILMLNKLIEKKQVKCHEYWPTQTGSLNCLHLPDAQLRVELLGSEEFVDYTKRRFALIDSESGSSHEVLQFQYNTWPDFGVPSTPLAFLQFLKQVRQAGVLGPEVGPAIVHCSAGIGRSGTFCLVDSCLVLHDNDSDAKTSVKEVLLELRRSRLGLIQTDRQLYFSYKAIIEGIRLFKDASFLNSEEVPLAASESGVSGGCDDAVPPPLPPPRNESKLLSHNQHSHDAKPLPGIPHSVSAHELLDRENRNHHHNNTANTVNANHQHQQLDANNTISTGITSINSNHHHPIMGRPLPPLPPNAGNSLQSIDEPDTDSGSDSDGDAEDSSDDDDADEIEIEEEEEDEDAVLGVDDDEDSDDVPAARARRDAAAQQKRNQSNQSNSSHSDIECANGHSSRSNSSSGDGVSDAEVRSSSHDEEMSATAKATVRLTNGASQAVDAPSFDANSTLPPSPVRKSATAAEFTVEAAGQVKSSAESNDAPEVRRRKRAERQSAMEERVREIKRRQQDAEEAPKKRRSLVIRIASGLGIVLVGLACVYTYVYTTRLN